MAAARGGTIAAHSDDLTDQELEALYAPPAGRHVRSDFVASLDGAVEVDGRSGGLGSDDDHRVFVTLRALSDVILVGSGTAVAENYGPARLDPGRRARRVARGQEELPPIAVVSSQASLDPNSRLFVGDGGVYGNGPRPIVLCAAAAPTERRAALRQVADVIECGAERVDVVAGLDALADRGLRSVLCEGGPTLAGVLLERGALDELCLSQALVLAGPGHQALSGGAPFASPVPLRLGHLLVGQNVLLGRWEIVR